MSAAKLNHSFIAEHKDTLVAVGISLFAMFLYLAIIPATELWDRDEPLYARTAMEMLLSGNWMIPTYNGQLFAHKPPMTYWLMAISFAMFGEGEFASRFFSAPSMALSGFITYLIAKKMFDHVVGIWSLIMFSSALMTMYLGSIAQHDAPLILFILLAIYAYVKLAYEREDLVRLLLLFSLSMAATFYIKGPVGPVVICSTLFFSWFFTPVHERVEFKIMVMFAAAFLLSCALFSIWLIPTNIVTEGELWRVGVERHILQRFQAPLENYGGIATLGYYWLLPLYVPIVMIAFMPWTIYLPAGLKTLFSGRLCERKTSALLLGWLIPTFTIFTLAGSKLPHYIFPVFPPLAILCSAVMINHVRGKAMLSYSMLGTYSYLVLSAGFALILIITPFMRPDIIQVWIGFPFAVIVAVIIYIVFSRQKSGEILFVSKVLAVTTSFLVVFAYWFVVPPAEPLIKISKSIGEIINNADISKDRIFMEGYLEPSMVFYISAPINAPLRNLPTDLALLRAEFAHRNEMLLIATQERFNVLREFENQRPFQIIGEVQAINTNNSLKEQTIVVAFRK